MLNTVHLVYELGQSRTRRRGKPSQDDLLILGIVPPQNGVDLLYFIGGHLADHHALPLNIDREEMAHVFGTRSAAMFLRETSVTTRLLTHLRAVFDNLDTRQITSLALASELDSLWSSLSLYNQRQVREPLAQQCQQLAGLIDLIVEGSNDRVLADSGIGRQLETGQRQPQTALEALRWIHGYFARKHVRTRTS